MYFATSNYNWCFNQTECLINMENFKIASIFYDTVGIFVQCYSQKCWVFPIIWNFYIWSFKLQIKFYLLFFESSSVFRFFLMENLRKNQLFKRLWIYQSSSLKPPKKLQESINFQPCTNNYGNMLSKYLPWTVAIIYFYSICTNYFWFNLFVFKKLYQFGGQY